MLAVARVLPAAMAVETVQPGLRWVAVGTQGGAVGTQGTVAVRAVREAARGRPW